MNAADVESIVPRSHERPDAVEADGASGLTGGSSRTRIEEAAVDLFFRQGFLNTSVKQIMLACALTQGALYNHFSSKDELLLSILHRAHDELDTALDAALTAADDDPVEQLRAAAHAFAEVHARRQKLALVNNQEYTQLPDELRRQVVERRRIVRQLFEDILERGVKSGQFRIPETTAGPETTIVAMAILTMGVRISYWFEPDGRLSVQDVAAVHAQLVLQTVGVPQRSSRPSVRP